MEKKIQNFGITMNTMCKIWSEAGATVRKYPVMHHMVEMRNGSRLEHRFTPVEITFNGNTMCQVWMENLNQVWYTAESAKEAIQCLTKMGFKTAKAFYTKELNMPEDTWNEWNGIRTEEDE